MKKRVLFILNHLEIGGAEKVLITFLKNLDYSYYDVEILTHMERLMKNGTYAEILDLDTVTKTGKNLSEIMQTITGPVYVYSVDNGYAHSKLVTYMYGTDFLTSKFENDKYYN